MAKAGGKGKVSNDLVAASCAAVLGVYGAGYWRTRDEARRFETRGQERASLTERSAAAGTQTAAIGIDKPVPPPPETGSTISPSKVAAAPSATAVAAKVPPTTVAVAPPSAAGAEQAAALAETSVAAVAVTSMTEPDSASVAAPDPQPVPAGNWRDGTFTGWGTSRHGDIKVQVVIRNGRIVESSIASCETRWPCDVISAIIHQPVERQNADVDRVSRATESTNAYYYAVVDALEDAIVQPAVQATTPR